MIAKPRVRADEMKKDDVDYDIPVARTLTFLDDSAMRAFVKEFSPLTIDKVMATVFKYVAGNLYGLSQRLNVYTPTFFPNLFYDWNARPRKFKGGQTDQEDGLHKYDEEDPDKNLIVDVNHFDFGDNKPLRSSKKEVDDEMERKEGPCPVLYPLSLFKVEQFYEDLVTQASRGLYDLIRREYSTKSLYLAMDNYFLLCNKIESLTRKISVRPERPSAEIEEEAAKGEIQELIQAHNFLSICVALLRHKIQVRRLKEINRVRSLRNRYHSNIEVNCLPVDYNETVRKITDGSTEVTVQYFLLGNNILVTNFSNMKAMFHPDDYDDLQNQVQEGIKQKLKKRKSPEFIDQIVFVYNNSSDSIEI